MTTKDVEMHGNSPGPTLNIHRKKMARILQKQKTRNFENSRSNSGSEFQSPKTAVTGRTMRPGIAGIGTLHISSPQVAGRLTVEKLKKSLERRENSKLVDKSTNEKGGGETTTTE